MITGGTTHALCCLSACLQYAIRSDRIILPYSENHPYYSSTFYSFYDPNLRSPLSRYLIKPEDYETVRDSYIAPFEGMPTTLRDSLIAGPKPDSSGTHRYYLEGITEIQNNERYLDYPSIRNEGKKYITTWGRHDKYWKNQVTSVLNTLNPSPELQRSISKYLREIEEKIGHRKYIGVHFRNTDYRSDINEVIKKTVTLASNSQITTVFWATDDASSKEKLEAKLEHTGINAVFIDNIIDHRKMDSKNLHSISNVELKKMGSSKIDQLAIFYAEIITLGKSSVFLPSSGTVPLLVEGIRRSKGKWVRI